MSFKEEFKNPELAERLYAAFWTAIEKPLCEKSKVCVPEMCNDVVKVIVKFWLATVEGYNTSELSRIIPLENIVSFMKTLTEFKYKAQIAADAEINHQTIEEMIDDATAINILPLFSSEKEHLRIKTLVNMYMKRS